MTVEITGGTLTELVDRLAAFEPVGAPVLSLFLDARPDQQGRDHFLPFLRKELKARAQTFAARSPERESFERDAARIQDWAQHERRASANAIALFACSAAGLFECAQLDAPMDASRLHVDALPHIYPLVRLLDQYPRYAALLADSNLARIYVFELGSRLREERVQNPKWHRTDAGGWSQMRYQRHVDNAYRQHAREVVETLEKVVRAEGVKHVVLAGDEVIVPLLKEQLGPSLAQKVVDVLALDIRTPETQVLAETMEALRHKDAQTDAERVRLFLDEYRAGGLAVAGLSACEAALGQGQVHELLIAAEARPLHDPGDAPGVDEQAAGDSAQEQGERLARAARQTGAQVVMIEEAGLLDPVGGVGALLRFALEGPSDAARQTEETG